MRASAHVAHEQEGSSDGGKDREREREREQERRQQGKLSVINKEQASRSTHAKGFKF